MCTIKYYIILIIIMITYIIYDFTYYISDYIYYIWLYIWSYIFCFIYTLRIRSNVALYYSGGFTDFANMASQIVHRFYHNVKYVGINGLLWNIRYFATGFQCDFWFECFASDAEYIFQSHTFNIITSQLKL